MESSLNWIFIAAVVTLFALNLQTKEIRTGKVVLGAGHLKKPRNETSVFAYSRVAENITPLRRYFYWRNILKLLFGAYCLAAFTYLALLALSLFKIKPVAPAQPNGIGDVEAKVKIVAPGTPYDSNSYDLESFLVLTQSPANKIEAFPMKVAENEGQLVWLSGNGSLTEIDIGTSMQFFGVMAVFLGIATFAVATILRDQD